MRGRHSPRFLRREAARSAAEEGRGPRRNVLERRKRRARRRAIAGILLAGLLLVAGAGRLLSAVSADQDGPARKTPEVPATERGDPVSSTLVFGTREQGDEVVWISLLTYDHDNREGAIVFIPPHTAVEVPGRGLQSMAEAHTSGGIPLLLMSAETLLGMDVDRYLELSEGDARMLFEATGPVSVDVPAEVRVGAGRNTARVVFEQGRQRLDAAFLVQLLYTVGLDVDDIELGNRHLAFWQGLFRAVDEQELAQALHQARAALAESDAKADDHERFFKAMASLPEEDRTIGTIPVEQVSVGGGELYFADGKELAAFLEETVGTSSQAENAIRVQVLNGNGEPGIGQAVAARLVDEGFKVILSSNARSFDYDKTLIITYGESAQAEAAAQRARELLGLGEVQVSEQWQGIVDLTIVVGKDFLRKL